MTKQDAKLVRFHPGEMQQMAHFLNELETHSIDYTVERDGPNWLIGLTDGFGSWGDEPEKPSTTAPAKGRNYYLED